MIGAKDGSKELEGALEDLDLIVVKNSDGVFELTERIKELEGATKTATLEEGIQDAADAADALSTKAQELRRSFGTGDLFGKSLLEISGVESEIIKLGVSFESGEIGLKEYASSFDELFVTVQNRTKGLRDYRQGLFELSEQLSETEEKQKSISSAISGSSDVVNENQSSIDRLIDRLVVQAQAANDSANSTAFYKAQQLGATEAEIERVKSLQGVIDKQKDLAAAEAKAASDKKAADAKVKAEKGSADKALEGVRRQLLDREGLIAANAKRQLDIVKKNEELLLISAKESADLELEIEADKQEKLETLRKKEEDSKNKFRTAELTAAGDFLTLIGNISGAENKKQFERNKKLRVAGATISGIAATVDAYRSGAETNIFVGAAYAAIAAAATGAQIAQIKNQQYPGRAIGGQVTDGQAYRVGEFGPETFVPSSSGRIIPTGQDAANDGRMVEVVNNIKVIGGDENAQVTTTTTQQSDRKVIQDIVVDLMRNQSSPARQALQQTSNVVPRGTR
jgi:SLT domain-containing protein